ncbi:activating transcription factor 3 isoform X2 [Aethina tumida]|uniref:activating transcription factor 3 isoform X2 n=1 Tax=Aethina tumida TaxID=116153 RepID=UPI00096B1A13|nr:activating transcription factor 3 isoform X2 [Aethina tumida]
MYNLNVNLAQQAATAVNNLLVESSCNTPRTPEILNSVIAMTSPFDLPLNNENQTQQQSQRIAGGSCGGPLANISSDSNSSSSSHVESPTTNPPSVQDTCSQLIKASLRVTIEKKRKHQGDPDDLLDLDKIKRIKRTESESEEDKIKQESGLTPEDEERRRRRRERNKIAATKCRLKKRERTANLVTEAETLEAQNLDFKSQLSELQKQMNTLQNLLSRHRPQCQHNIGPATREHLGRLPPVSSVLESHSYSRPPSNEPAFQNVNYFGRSDGMAMSSSPYTRSTPTYTRTPNIVVVEPIQDNYDNQHFTDLDDYSSFNTQCHNYSGSQNYGNSGLDNGCMA